MEVSQLLGKENGPKDEIEDEDGEDPTSDQFEDVPDEVLKVEPIAESGVPVHGTGSEE